MVWRVGRRKHWWLIFSFSFNGQCLLLSGGQGGVVEERGEKRAYVRDTSRDEVDEVEPQDDGACGKDGDGGSEVKVLWPEREEPLVAEIGGVVRVEGVSFATDDRGAGGDEEGRGCDAADGDCDAAPAQQTRGSVVWTFVLLERFLRGRRRGSAVRLFS